MAVTCSCPEQWWRAPLYTSVSILLAFIAISSAIQATHRSSTAPSILAQQLSLNASSALRSSGFTAMAALLHTLPHTNYTVFALRDAAFSSASRPPRLTRDLFRYHIAPRTLSMEDLLKLPEGSCIPTYLPGKSVVVTRANASQRLLEINKVAVSIPDLFLSDTLAIHGVARPLSSLRFPPPSCKSNGSRVSVTDSAPIKWSEVFRWLDSHGRVTFSTALHAVLGSILEEGTDLRSATVFAPRRFGIESSSRRIRHRLDEIVRFHIVPQRRNFSELVSLSDGTFLRTLVPGRALVVTGDGGDGGGGGGGGGVRVNGITIEAPNAVLSENFVVHGISRAFDMAQPSIVSR